MKSSLIIESSLLCIVLNSCLFAQDSAQSMDDLLSQYRSESDLSIQTKKESAGSFIIFTRERLEKMQAYNLRDILKTIPWFTMQETVSGQVSMAMSKASTFNSQFLKLYINDHELGSIGFGSAMKMWGFLDISNIDHIEIYQVGSSVMVGDEPPGLVIRLYTKDPSRVMTEVLSRRWEVPEVPMSSVLTMPIKGKNIPAFFMPTPILKTESPTSAIVVPSELDVILKRTTFLLPCKEKISLLKLLSLV